MLPIPAFVQAASPALTYGVDSGSGLHVEVSGVPIVRGSWFQYYEPDWSRGYYSSSWNTQKVEAVGPGAYRVTFSSGPASGFEEFRREGDRILEDCEFDWSGDHPVKVEVGAGLLWAPAFEHGSLTAGALRLPDLSAKAFGKTATMESRRFSPERTDYRFDAPFGAVSLSASAPMTLFDARNGYPQDWAKGREVLWYGATGLEVSKGSPARLHLEWQVEPKAQREVLVASRALAGTRISDAEVPDERLPLLLPYPKQQELDFDHPVALPGGFNFPAGRTMHFDQFLRALARRVTLPAAPKGSVKFDGGISKLGYPPGGYRISIGPNGLSVYGEEDDGLRHGLERLASLVFVRRGKAMLPSGTLEDWPTIPWRGAHLFVGPEARAFHAKLWDRVLFPLGFNKAVLQCERTAWDATPGTGTAITMSKADLAALFSEYRARDVEPIPLIQSFGHMEWLFANGKNLDVAMDPADPHAVDPRKPRTERLVKSIWDEAIRLLHPSTVHFGLDEVDMVGFPKDPKLTTALWGQQLPMLGEIARSHGVGMMLWGDMGLAPGQAPDATNGATAEEAANRREAIPAGATIADWHYAALPKPDAFYPSLRIWKAQGLEPVAATWFEPENVRSFDIAAAQLGAGTLQTTWAGYESSEERMFAEFKQFSAMVLAAEYSWSGRQEPVDQLGYDPAEVFRRMYSARPSVLAPRAGVAFGWGNAVQVGTVSFRKLDPTRLRSLVTPGQEGAATEVRIEAKAVAREVDLALDTALHMDENDPVAEIRVQTDRGTVSRRLFYGQDVRAAGDSAACARSERGGGLCCVRVDLGPAPAKIERITLAAIGASAGLRLWGVTAPAP